MKITTTTHFPPSQPGQYMIERRTEGQPVQREICDAYPSFSKNPGAGTSVWAGRYGGWVRV